MAVFGPPMFSYKTALAYITIGALLDVWTVVWYFAFGRGGPEPLTNTGWFTLVGLFVSGIVLMAIGFLLGPMSDFVRYVETRSTTDSASGTEAASTSTPATPTPAIPAGAVVQPVLIQPVIQPTNGAVVPTSPTSPNGAAVAQTAASNGVAQS